MLMGLQGTAVWISKYSSLSNALRDTLRPIDQELYAAKSLYHREPSVYFNGQNGISLDAIKRRDFSSLADKDESAFPTLSSPRPSLRIQVSAGSIKIPFLHKCAPTRGSLVGSCKATISIARKSG